MAQRKPALNYCDCSKQNLGYDFNISRSFFLQYTLRYNFNLDSTVLSTKTGSLKAPFFIILRLCGS